MVFVNVVWNQVQFDNLKSQKLLDSELKYDDQVGFQIDSLTGHSHRRTNQCVETHFSEN